MIKSFVKEILKKILPIKVRMDLIHIHNKLFGLDSDYKGLTTEEVFEKVYRTGAWGKDSDGNSTSGSGSHTESLIEPYISTVNSILIDLGKPEIVDLGCGDFNIGKNFVKNSRSYLACDISKTILDRNRKNFQDSNLKFQHLNLVKDDLPKGDIAFVRQVLQHLGNDEIASFVKNLNKNVPYKFLLVTDHIPCTPNFKPNVDKPAGPGVRVSINSGVDLDSPPFNLKYKTKKVVLEVPQKIVGVDALIRTTLYTF